MNQKVNLEKILKEIFGYDSFRGMQKDIINHTLENKDSLVVMPTGSGKSICYQIPALVMNGVTIVISPLISLMQDQVATLKHMGIRADMINSSMDLYHLDIVKEEIKNNELDLLYVAPERLEDKEFMNLLKSVEVSLFAIDEAHCVSKWGHDFRPTYASLGFLKEAFKDVPIIALTATADDKTREDILDILKIKDRLFISGFDRPNIKLWARPKYKTKEQIVDFINKNYPKEAGIIYCMSRKNVEKTQEWLASLGYKSLKYHAGMTPFDRNENLKTFLNSEGYIMVATIAFGMGINKPNIRYVIHMDTPRNIESYYQEIGRAGRDGLPSHSLTFYSLQDIGFFNSILEQKSNPTQEHFKLMKLIGFLENNECRRKWLLNYFGENVTKKCNNCDVCDSKLQVKDYKKEAQLIIDGINDTNENFGISHIADIVTGKNNSKIKKFNHSELYSYNTINESLDQVKSIIREMMAQGYLKFRPNSFGVLEISNNNIGEFKAKVYEKPTVKELNPKKVVTHVEDKTLFDKLRSLRLKISQQEEIAPYMVFQDKSLKEMADIKPKNKEELLNVHGVGKYKVQRYGKIFLNVILKNL